MALGLATIGALTLGAGLAGGAIGKGLGTRKARKLEEELAKTSAGKALAAETDKAAARQLSGNYGMSEAERRKTGAQIGEAPREEARQVRRQMLEEAVKGGMLGRSGSTIAALTGLERAVAESGAKAGGQAAQASQQAAAVQKAQDAGTLSTAYLGEVAKQDKREQLKALLGKRSAEFTQSLAQAGLSGIGTTASAAGPAAGAAAGKVA